MAARTGMSVAGRNCAGGKWRERRHRILRVLTASLAVALASLCGAALAGEPRRLSTVTTGHSELSALAFSPDGNLMLTGGDDGTLELRQVPSGRLVRRLDQHGDRVMAATFAPDRGMAATADADRFVRLWDVASGALLHILDAGTGLPRALVFVPGTRLVAAGGDDKTLRVWNIDSGAPVHRSRVDTSTATMGIGGLAVSQDGKALLAGTVHQARLIEPKSGRPVRDIDISAPSTLSRIALSGDGRRIATAEGDGTLSVWEAGRGSEVWSTPGDRWSMLALAFSSDGRRVHSLHADRTLRVADAATGRLITAARLTDREPDGFAAAAFSPDGQRAAFWEVGPEVTLWSVDGEAAALPAAMVIPPASDAPGPATVSPSAPAGSLPSPAMGRRLALVIGNSAYRHVSPLANPQNDARLMESALREAGFEVTQVLDADLTQMRRALLAFGRALREGNVEAGLIYYAGHGVQVGGENYLVPVSAQIADEDEIPIETINANDMLRTLESAGSRINIVVLDACRNNPFARSVRSATRGLAPVDAPRGTVIAYATSPGDVASDGEAGNSPYAAALAGAIREARGLPIESVFKATRRQVLAATGEKQVPWETSSITGEFYFHPQSGSAGPAAPRPVAAAPAPALAPTPARVELALAPSPPPVIHAPAPGRSAIGCRQVDFDAGPARLCASSELAGQHGNGYGVGNLADGDRATAWVEGERGDGIGETLLVLFERPTRIKGLSLINGYDKNTDIFTKNNRVATVELRSSRGDMVGAALQDRGGWQRILDRDLGDVTWIELSITAVNRGSKYRDTAISELRIE
ncbi:WD domain-containing protein, G-beta repeat-containing protein [Ancylobacter rudongensis]|uniref:WD domain-containing protein, G-beta repeat-containing protein n=1 Tax=Ancylobacter rudongensis TaxID=177413 RepID=A0A1G4SBN5_9HYPH|nr:WD domain-containing protein, G-beta repeat-containing protein [Ancylobacter rudongensis]